MSGSSEPDDTGTELFRRTLAYDLGCPESNSLMARVWRPTPWMVDAFTGGVGEDRDREMIMWCADRFGQESSPIHGTPGHWHRGSATVHGWTWYGFASEAMLREFLAAWPIPPGESPPPSDERRATGARPALQGGATRGGEDSLTPGGGSSPGPSVTGNSNLDFSQVSGSET